MDAGWMAFGIDQLLGKHGVSKPAEAVRVVLTRINFDGFKAHAKLFSQVIEAGFRAHEIVGKAQAQNLAAIGHPIFYRCQITVA